VNKQKIKIKIKIKIKKNKNKKGIKKYKKLYFFIILNTCIVKPI